MNLENNGNFMIQTKDASLSGFILTVFSLDPFLILERKIYLERGSTLYPKSMNRLSDGGILLTYSSIVSLKIMAKVWTDLSICSNLEVY